MRAGADWLGRTGVRWTLAGLLACAAGPAAAQFAVCNQTLDALNLAVATDDGQEFTSEGWWTIGANRCVDVLKDELKGRYVFVYATDVFGQPILPADAAGEQLCIDAGRFAIRGAESCWQRGFQAVRFMEVDTLSQVRWTLFLKDPDAQ